MPRPSVQQIVSTVPRRFRKEKAGNFSGIYHFDIRGSEGGQYSIVINNGTCSVEQGLIGKPTCKVTLKDRTYVKLELGEVNPQMQLVLGRVKVSNVAALLQFGKLFVPFSIDLLQESKEEAKVEVFDTKEVQKEAANEESPKPDSEIDQAVQKSFAVSSRKPEKGPLQGVRILDVSRLLPGPLATMLLADMGAEVIKIEDPSSPDPTRTIPPFVGKESAYYLAVNRSKRSLTLNLHSQKGKELFLELVKTADIVLEQYRPGIMDKIGIGYSKATSINPNIIYVSITGFGQDGPYSQQAGHDINYLAYSGILGITGIKDGKPVIPGVQIADIAAGSYTAVNACLLALLNRQRTGKGEQVDVSMTDACMPLMAFPMAMYQTSGNIAQRGNEMLSGAIPNYNVYECKDGKYLALGALEPKFWAGFCEMIEFPEWNAEAFAGPVKAEILMAKLQVLFKTKTQAEWLEQAKGFDICLSPVNDVKEVFADPQLKHRQIFVTHTHPQYGEVTTINNPVKFTKTETNRGWASPSLGEDTSAILTKMGYAEIQILELKKDGII